MLRQPASARGASEALDRLAINTIRTLAMDAVEKAQSGHPGTPMALAPVGHTLWAQFLRIDPDVPDWPNRDRFVLSVGHASMLLYALIHLAGIKEVDAEGRATGLPAVSLDDIKNFRQLGSRTPGHPEYRVTTGVETTTGPLGQGCGNSVGMAVAERWLAQHFNRDGFTLFDHDVYVLCGDGDMMEGVSGEAASLAGHLKLSNLCWIYDSNRISIEGHTDLAFTEDVGKRFQSYGWNVLHVDDANDTEAFAHAIESFKATDDRPTFVVVHSIIGWGSPKADSEKAHGEPLGADAIVATKKAYGWPEDKTFYVPDGVAKRFNEAIASRGRPLREEWEATFAGYRETYPGMAAELDAMRKGAPPPGWETGLPSFDPDPKGVASRDSAGKVLNALASNVPWLVGGSADLSPSTKTDLKKFGSFQADNPSGRTMHFGVREHAMGAIANGMALSYIKPFAATFLVFADYMRAPVRLAAIMELPVTFVFTHDSIGVGEDGPTHQPIEHLATLRAMPGLDTIRPGDANEAAEAWKLAVRQTRRPSALILSRQALPTLDRSRYAAAAGVARGAYILAGADDPELILIGTGSELSLVVGAYEKLAAEGVRARVVSMPSWSRFEEQDDAYKESVLTPGIEARLAVEQGGAIGWDRYVGARGRTITMSTFGASAPLAKLQEKFGFTVDHVVEAARSMILQEA
ncbi:MULTISPECIES: transketolase [Sphingomonas]|uniref:Transketolase n=1 Tax=Sphingomonas molluscorum TaxID=418184 RepID=A0ABU8Q9M0_9SPHN|nr:transketolase [Sphingomonas sp. JUb134]MBM7407796.1 transketolase [Sphingomonas sp. JUb134]